MSYQDGIYRQHRARVAGFVLGYSLMISGLPHMSFRFSALRAALTIETVVAIDHEVGVHPREVHQRTVTSRKLVAEYYWRLSNTDRKLARSVTGKNRVYDDCVNRATNESGNDL